ncbi:right-handed parallel beta-helix repeat-containing protein [Fibrella forsythiae]|uniref:Right-handed parallel beta-helix repeat-containing protein n=1 Tax=Fibrella forsythiae TaxID=2817061 RepID=A0ABS3JNG2_9BACT|nr:right-handed parallel beta-helix repeat-containing protein [Fibrella forsythiae]MBO0951546.1 right-handed parallel beta-helix repeat-containing protein [Fibrella forsythiae]
MNKFTLLFFFLFTHFVCSGTNFYIKQGNSTSNNGLTPATAVGLNSTGAIPNAVLSTIQPGDFIYLIGTFTNPSYTANSPAGVPVDDPRFWHGENTVRISNLNGSAGRYITLKPYDSTTLLKGDGGNILRIQNSSYLRIDGFTVQGEVDNLPLSVANALQFVYILGSASNLLDPTPAEIHYRDQDCISNCTPGLVVDGEVYSSLNPNQVYRPTYYDTRGMYLSDVNHIDIVNNHIHHMPGGGLRVSDCEDILIEGNEINDCSRRSSGGTHGLVVTKATSTRTGDDYRISLLRNLVHHNYNEQYSWAPDKTVITPHIDEGKGISLQRNQTVPGVNWDNGRILIANNICYYNGYSGIHSNDGNRIDIVNNSCYFNSYTGSITIGGTNPNGGNIGISISGGTGHKIVNNIVVIDNNMTRSPISTDITTPGAMIVKNNIIYGTTGAVGTDLNIDAIQENTQMVSPQFTNQNAFDFTLVGTSPAIDNAFVAPYVPTVDYYGNARTTPDIGAVEFQSALAVDLLDFSGQATEEGNLVTWSTAMEMKNNYFEVEQSTNVKDWRSLGRVSSKGNSQAAQRYRFQHKNVTSKINYYRLKIVDTDEKYELSKVVSVINERTQKLLVYPNPFSQSIWLEGVEAGDMIHIFDETGKAVRTVRMDIVTDNRFKLDTSALQANKLYFLKTGNTVSKLLKQLN